MLAIAIIINNYFHDVATAFLLASAVVVWLLGRVASSGGSADARFLVRAMPMLRRIAWAALGWIVVGGIPRTIFFTRYEWDPAVVKGIVPALMVKHVLMVAAVALGAIVWVRVSRQARALAEAASED